MDRHVSDSSEQREAERFMLSELARTLQLVLSDGASVRALPSDLRPDGIDSENRVLVEAYAHLGKLKGAQPHKVKGDILKLIFLERKLGGSWRKILCFADDQAAASLRGRSWLAEAAREFGVEVCVTPLPSSLAESVRSAQHRQRMENPK